LNLLVDENLSIGLLVALNEAGHDAQHTRELGLERAADPLILERCCRQRRMLITADKKLTKFLASSG
jgi:predicted nuclease of predicted toxin-antitoxin system